MSKPVERRDRGGGSDAETGLEALRRSSAFRGPAEPPDGHVHDERNDHFASLYEDSEAQFAAVVPFVRQGLDRGERCLYIADDNAREDVLAALREGGIDVDAALDSGALKIYGREDTYLRTGDFDRDAMVAFWKDALDRAKRVEGYTGVRAAAEMTWALESDTDADSLVEYESILNDVFNREDYVVLCQYNRSRFPAEIVRDVVRTHPLLVSGDAVYHNVYYAPPEEFFGPDDPAREVERMMGTLRERTEVKTELRERQRHLRDQYEIAADADRSFGEKLDALLDLGCERFDLELGGLARIDPETDTFEIEAVRGEHDRLVEGVRFPLSETYCRVFGDDRNVAGITDPCEEGFENATAYEEFGVRTYLGTRIELDDDHDRTLFFVSTDPREEPFSEDERTFHHLMGQWVQYELERDRRERELEHKHDRLESFASMLAHELRNPVTIGQIYTQQLPGDTDAVEYVSDAFDRIENMIDVMLVLTRGREVVHSADSVELDTVVREAWNEVDAPGATLDVALDRTIAADETYVRHLFRNLLENAVEHGSTSQRSQAHEDAVEHGSTSQRSQAHEDAVEHGSTSNRPEADDVHQTSSDAAHQNPSDSEDAVEHGGSDVSVTVGELPADSGSDASGGFYVADDGPGIPADERDAVFEAGYTTASDNGGIGLGLAFVRELAAMYEWTCEATESAAGGARFEFRGVEFEE